MPTLPVKAELHSPLSPLSPGSPIFPDGLFTSAWFDKHQHQVPCLFLAFFDITAGDASRDEQIKADINIIRTSISRSGYKTRFAAILLSDRSILQSPDLEERLSSIRRLTSLDSKTGLFFMPPMSSNAEIATFVQSIVTTLQPLCVEYYRELTKHARRKKARGGPPPSASVHLGAGSQSLSNSGWNCRYEVKQGVFAEFRQEMDIAERHYTTAIDELFNSEGIFEATPSWSPRWGEARLLCDALAIRTIRCQLWVAQTTGAVQSWINYKDRMRDLIDRRGKGSETYGWAAWEATWAEVMSELVIRADVSVQRAPDGRVDEEDGENAVMKFHMAPEKSYSSFERLRPFQSLHHAGYWLKLATDGARQRRQRAESIPDEDRIPPGQSPASAVANRVRNYDLYLVPEPHQEAQHDHIPDITRLTELAIEQFEVKGQGRMMEILKFDLARDLVAAKRYRKATNILQPLWESSSWRQEDWHQLFDELLSLLSTCARPSNLNHAQLAIATEYELLSSAVLPDDSIFEFSQCLKDFTPSEDTLQLSYRDKERTSPIGFEFAFEAPESYVGEALECQLTIHCRARRSSQMSLRDVTLLFGQLRSVKIRAAKESKSSEKDAASLDRLDSVQETEGSLEGESSLRFNAGQKRTIEFSIALREAGLLRLTAAAFTLCGEKFEIQHSFSEECIAAADSMMVRSGSHLQRRHLPCAETMTVTVLPKPPKVRVVVHGQHKKYYTDELLSLTVEVVNDEVEDVSGKITADARSQDGVKLALSWPVAHVTASQLVHTELSSLKAGSSRSFELQAQAPSEPGATSLNIEVEYTLSTETGSPLRKACVLDMSFVKPFEAQYNFGPVLYADKWPSYFNAENGMSEESPGGIPQLWRLSSQIRSLATETVVLHAVEAVKEHITGDSTCTVRERDLDEQQTLAHGEIAEKMFQLKTQKYSLEDRRPTMLESSVLITWSRDDRSSSFTTTLPVPRLTLPVSEPRVLCVLSEESPEEVDATLQYYIENPSTHFLTFALTMEASEDFAFSGPKYRTLSLAPLSRHRVECAITLYDNAPAAKEDGRWIWPLLQVMDSYYQKNLKVHAAGPDVKMDEKGAIGVWIEL